MYNGQHALIVYDDLSRQAIAEQDPEKKKSIYDQMAKMGTRSSIMSDLGLDIAQSPEAKAFQNAQQEDKAQSYGQTLAFQKQQEDQRPADEAFNESLKPRFLKDTNLERFAVPTIDRKDQRQIAGEYGYPASAEPQAKEAIANIETMERNAKTGTGAGQGG